MKRVTCLLLLTAVAAVAMAAAEPNVPTIVRTWTNRIDQVRAIISTVPVLKPCPECGAQNHHNEQVAVMTSFDQVYSTIVFNGITNTVLVGTGSQTNWTRTNLVYAVKQSQPGWQAAPPPLPRSTNVNQVTP